MTLITDRRIALALLGLLAALKVNAVDVYEAAPTAETIALGGIYLGSIGPTDAQIPGTRLSIGLGVFPVSLLTDKWRFQDPPGTAGASYGIQLNKSAFIAIQSSFGLGFQISRWLSAGAALGVVDNLNTLETPYRFQTNPTLAGLKTLLDLHTSGIGYNGTFGIVAQPTPRLKLGLAYKTQTTIRSTGNASGSAYAQFVALGLPFASGFNYKAEVDNVFPKRRRSVWLGKHGDVF